MVGHALDTSKMYWNEFRKPIWVVPTVQNHGKIVLWVRRLRPATCGGGGGGGVHASVFSRQLLVHQCQQGGSLGDPLCFSSGLCVLVMVGKARTTCRAPVTSMDNRGWATLGVYSIMHWEARKESTGQMGRGSHFPP